MLKKIFKIPIKHRKHLKNSIIKNTKINLEIPENSNKKIGAKSYKNYYYTQKFQKKLAKKIQRKLDTKFSKKWWEIRKMPINYKRN